MQDDRFQLRPIDPTTQSKISLIVQRHSNEPMSLTINEWRRILPNKNTIRIDNNSSAYQCNPLDKNSVIEIKFTYQKFGNFITRSLATKPVKLSSQLRQRMLYQIQPFKSTVIVDDFKAPMAVSIHRNRIIFGADIGKFDIPITENSIQPDHNQTCLRINLNHSQNQFLNFYSASLRWTPKYRSNTCVILFATAVDRNLFLAQAADCFQSNLSSSKISNHTPRNDKSPKLAKDTSNTSLHSTNKSKTKQNKQKVKISERLNLKRSYNKSVVNKQSQPQSGQCLNIFEEEDDFPVINTQSSIQGHDESMDLRGSFEEFQQKSFSRIEQDKVSNHSFRSKTPATGTSKNNVHQQNAALRKRIQELEGILSSWKKKLAASDNQVDRLQNLRTALSNSKAKYEIKYRKQRQQKQALQKIVDLYKAKYGQI